MYYKYFFNIVLSILFFTACTTVKKVPTTPKPTEPVAVPAPVKDNAKTDELLQNLLQQYPQFFSNIINNRKELNTQIIYTQINRDAKGTPLLNTFYFNVDADKYFYPASTVKLPICLLALQKLNELKTTGIDKNTTMITEAGSPLQTAVYNDPTTPDGRPTIANYIKKILMVSDNDAFNRLYEFLGQEYINKELQQKGYKDVQILHRLQIALPEIENRQTNPIKFYDSNSTLLYQQPLQMSKLLYTKRTDSLGRGFYQAGNLVEQPMNFATKNRISLQDLHEILMSIIFPDRFNADKRFNITAEDRQFVLQYMSKLPTESTYPPYQADTANYWPAYCKFLLFGSEKGSLPKNIRIFNKVGDAYGQMLDVAYVVDFEKGVEFFVSAAIYCNSDGVLNDDKYDYDTIGFPFMKNLGKVIYDYEVKRTKSHLPNLSALIFDYKN